MRSYSLFCPNLRSLALAVPLLLTGCSLIPPFLLPEFATPETFKEARTAAQAEMPWQPANPAVPQSDAPWQLFALDELPNLLQRLDTANASLAVAQARYAQAAALIDQASAGLWPTLSANAGVTRARTNGTTSPTTTQTLGLSSAWEIDLWGRLRASVLSNEASAEASAADLAGVRLALQGQLVQALLSYRVVEVQRQLLAATVADYERYRQLTADRQRFGIASRADLAQAETLLRTAQAQAIDTGVQAAQLEHAIAVLVGELPSNFSLPAQTKAATAWRAPLRTLDGAASPSTSTSLPVAAPATAGAPPTAAIHASILGQVPALPTLPLSAPSTLLERRPDIVAAAQRAAAANAGIGIAQAAFFPVLNLSAAGGQRSTIWGEIFNAPARFWSLGPAMVAPLFDGGLRSAQKAQAQAVWEQAAATYRQTVLAGFQEVEDQLATLRILAEEAVVQGEAVKAARLSAELALAQYQAGTVGSLQVIVANNALLTAERSALDLHNRRLTAAVVLVRALGGGWTATAGKSPE